MPLPAIVLFSSVPALVAAVSVDAGPVARARAMPRSGRAARRPAATRPRATGAERVRRQFVALDRPPRGAAGERDAVAGAEAQQRAAHRAVRRADHAQVIAARALGGDRRGEGERARAQHAALEREPRRGGADAHVGVRVGADDVAKERIATPRTAQSAAWTSTPIARPAASISSTSGAATPASARPPAPTVPTVPRVPGFVSPPLAVWVVPSSHVAAPVIAGSASGTPMRTTPRSSQLASPARRPGRAAGPGTMKIDASTPAGLPTWARPALPSAFALTRNCRTEPWPDACTLVTTSKL